MFNNRGMGLPTCQCVVLATTFAKYFLGEDHGNAMDAMPDATQYISMIHVLLHARCIDNMEMKRISGKPLNLQPRKW